MILVAVVVYKATKEDCSITEGMTCCDVDVISRAQYYLRLWHLTIAVLFRPVDLKVTPYGKQNNMLVTQ